MNCYNGITLPTPVEAPCGGEYIDTSCVASSKAIISIEVVAGDTQDTINKNIGDAFTYKDIQIAALSKDIASYKERKVYRGSFLGSTLSTPVEDTINDISVTRLAAGLYLIASDSINKTTNILITPNTLGDEDVVVSYNYTDIDLGEVQAIVKNLNGDFVDLAESPIKIEI